MAPFTELQRPQPEQPPTLPERESQVPEDFPEEVPMQQPRRSRCRLRAHCSRYSPLPAMLCPQSSRKAKAVVSSARKPKPRMQPA